MTEKMQFVSKYSRRQNLKTYLLTLASLTFGIAIDCYLFSHEPISLAYVPFMTLLGFFSKYIVTKIIFSGFSSLLVEMASPFDWTVELFLLRWAAYFFIAYVFHVLIENNKKEQENIIDLISILSEAIDARDNYTSHHSQNVAYYSTKLGRELKLSDEECNHLFIGGLLHDFGKIGIPELVLNKPSKLTKEEYELIKLHPVIGYKMLQRVDYFKKNYILDMILSHHEKYDGTGYPRGLKGKEIPLVARIMAVADSFDAMTSNRIYREDKGLGYAIQQIREGKGRQFDPFVAEIFLEMIRDRKIVVKGFEEKKLF